MSALITLHEGRPKISIHAPDSRTRISQIDLDGWVIEITGKANLPFIQSVSFDNCLVIADDMSAFNACYFEDCQMDIKCRAKQD